MKICWLSILLYRVKSVAVIVTYEFSQKLHKSKYLHTAKSLHLSRHLYADKLDKKSVSRFRRLWKYNTSDKNTNNIFIPIPISYLVIVLCCWGSQMLNICNYTTGSWFQVPSYVQIGSYGGLCVCVLTPWDVIVCPPVDDMERCRTYDIPNKAMLDQQLR